MVHVIIDITIKDEEMYNEYIRQVSPIVKQFGGKYLVRGGAITPLAGGWNPERIIVLEFESKEQVFTWLKSPEYAQVAGLREQSTSSKAIIIESGELPVD